MKKLIIAFVLLSITVRAQVKFEQGYFIDNAGARKECLIKNIDWKLNPLSFEYQDNNQTKVAEVSDVKEFAVGSQKKYVRAMIKVDTSRDVVASDISKMSQTIAPLWATKTALVKVIVEGKMNLYSYANRHFNSCTFSSSIPAHFQPSKNRKKCLS